MQSKEYMYSCCLVITTDSINLNTSKWSVQKQFILHSIFVFSVISWNVIILFTCKVCISMILKFKKKTQKNHFYQINLKIRNLNYPHIKIYNITIRQKKSIHDTKRITFNIVLLTSVCSVCVVDNTIKLFCSVHSP
jgi:hypothetical protein